MLGSILARFRRSHSPQEEKTQHGQAVGEDADSQAAEGEEDQQDNCEIEQKDATPHSAHAHLSPEIRDAITIISDFSSLGKRLVDWAEINEIVYLVKDNKSMKECLGTYYGKEVAINENNDTALNVSIIAHELMHAVQDICWDMLKTSHGNDLRAAFIYRLSYESAAETCAVRICYEAKLNGNDSGYKAFFEDPKLKSYTPIMEAFERGYNQSIAQGQACEEASVNGGQQAFNAYWNSHHLIRIYGDTLLYEYAESLLRNDKNKYVQRKVFGSVCAKNVAQISEGEFLIHEVIFPLSDAALFKGDNQLRQAFDYVDYKRRFQFYDKIRTNLDVQWTKAQLQADNNPYLCLGGLAEIVEVYERQLEVYKQGDESVPHPRMIKIMNELAGISEPAQLAFDFSAAVNDNMPGSEVDVPLPTVVNAPIPV